MGDYKDTFERWQKKATESLEEIDNQLGLKDKIGSSARVVAETAQKGASVVKGEAEKSDLGRRAVKAVEDLTSTAGDAAKTAWDVSGPIRDAAADAGSKAGGVVIDAVGGVHTNAKRVSRVVGFGAGLSSTIDSALGATKKAADRVVEDPLGAAATGVSMVVGAGLGVVVTGLSSHWLLNSAIPVWSVKKVAESFDGYLKRREALIEKGSLSEADAERIKFERDIAKRIGAPLLASYAFASGVVLMSNVLDPTRLSGFPVGTIIGGNPLLEGVWFFGNGLVCFKTSYDLFMIALEGEEEVEKMVADIKALLPANV